METVMSICIFGDNHPLKKEFCSARSNNWSDTYFALFNEKKVQITQFNTCREFFMGYVIKLVNEIDNGFKLFEKEEYNFGMYRLWENVNYTVDQNRKIIFDEEKIKEVYPRFKNYIYIGVKNGSIGKRKYETVRDIINEAEDNIGITQKTKIHYDKNTKICIFRASKNWYRSPEVLSFYTLLIRLAVSFVKTEYEKTLDNYINFSKTQLPIKAFENHNLLLNNKSSNFFSRFIVNNYKKKSYHNGFYDLQNSSDFKKRVKKFNKKMEKALA